MTHCNINNIMRARTGVDVRDMVVNPKLSKQRISSKETISEQPAYTASDSFYVYWIHTKMSL